jgi:hypothetical protein
VAACRACATTPNRGAVICAPTLQHACPSVAPGAFHVERFY